VRSPSHPRSRMPTSTRCHLSRGRYRMKRGRVLWHLVKADFLGRVRRTSFLVTLAFAVFLGYQTFAGHVVLRLDDYPASTTRRGSARSWAGHSSFLTLVGFYIVKGAILRDETTRVARSWPPHHEQSFYTLAKFLGNFAVLAAMVLVMQCGALHADVPRRRPRAAPLDFAFSLAALRLPRWPSLPRSPSLRDAAVLRAASAMSPGSSSDRAVSSRNRPAVTHGGSLTRADYFHDFSGLPTMVSRCERTAEGRPRFPGRYLPQIGGTAAASLCLDGIRWDSVQVAAAHVVRLRHRAALLASLFFHRFDPARERFARNNRRPRPPGCAGAGSSARTGAQRSMGRRLTPLPPASVKNRFFSVVVASFVSCCRAIAGGGTRCRRPHRRLSRRRYPPRARHYPRRLDLAHPDLVADGSREARYATGSLIFSRPHALQRQLRLSGSRAFWSRWPPAVDSPSVS